MTGRRVRKGMSEGGNGRHFHHENHRVFCITGRDESKRTTHSREMGGLQEAESLFLRMKAEKDVSCKTACILLFLIWPFCLIRWDTAGLLQLDAGFFFSFFPSSSFSSSVLGILHSIELISACGMELGMHFCIPKKAHLMNARSFTFFSNSFYILCYNEF